MKSFIAIFIFAALCFFAYLSFKRKLTTERKHRVAIIGWNGSIFSEKTIAGFEQKAASLFQKGTYLIDHFFISDQTTARNTVSEVLSRNYDVIVPIGALLAQTTKKLCDQRKSNTPVVFIGAVAPAKIGLVASEKHPGGTITGITLDNLPYQKIANTICQLYPTMKSVLIPWLPIDNGGRIEIDIQGMTKALAKNNVKAKHLVIEKIGDAHQKIAPLCSKFDGVLTMIGSEMAHATAGLAKLCKQNNTACICYDLSAAQREGAAIAYGPFVEEVGAAGASLVGDILIKKKHPSRLPINRMRDCYRVAVNKQNALDQKIQLSSNTLPEGVISF